MAHRSSDDDKQLPVAGESGQPVRRVLVFCIIGFALMMLAVDGTIVATALEALKEGLNTTVNWAGWTITAYALGFVLMLPVSGRLADRFGNRRVFIGSVAAFTAASLCCGLAGNIYVLIALRALQAAGGAGFTPSATGIIVAHFGDARDRAVGLFGSIFPIGGMIGPVLGGLIVTYWSWRGIFLVNVPIGLAVAILAYRYIPRSRPARKQTRTKMDFVGVALMGVGIVSGMLAAAYLGDPGAVVWSPRFVAPAALSVIALVLFFRHINRSVHPFILPRLIHGRGFGSVNLVNLLYGGGAAGIRILVPLYAINRYGMSALDAGLLLIPGGLAAVLFASGAAFALRHTGYRPLICAGCIVIAAGMAVLAVPPMAGISPYLWLAGATFLLGAGAGTINPATRNAGLQLEPDKTPAIAALRSMCIQVGRICTISIATAILASSIHPGDIQAWIYAAAAVILVAALPIISRVPEHRGAW